MSFENIKDSLNSYHWARRFNLWVRGEETIIIDGAHNFQGIESLLESSKNYLNYSKKRKLSLYFTFLKRKKWQIASQALINFINKENDCDLEINILSVDDNFESSEEIKKYVLENTKLEKDNLQLISLEEIGSTSYDSNNSLKIVFGSLSFPESLENNLIIQGFERGSIWKKIL